MQMRTLWSRWLWCSFCVILGCRGEEAEITKVLCKFADADPIVAGVIQYSRE